MHHHRAALKQRGGSIPRQRLQSAADLYPQLIA
jgi:hypothetical protein